jgi:adenylosuccinate lyase
MKYRIHIEIQYFLHLAKILKFDDQLSHKDTAILDEMYDMFSIADANHIKTIEKSTNHDVKAIEYFIKENFVHPTNSFIHYGLTSQDINTSANMLQIKHAVKFTLLPTIQKLIHLLKSKFYIPHKNTIMLSRTHGQAASPTTLGKEFMVFIERLEDQLNIEFTLPWTTKFGGATGNFNSLHLAHPDIDWIDFANKFVGSLDLTRSQYTTQIDHYDNLAAHFDTYKRINVILINLCQDIWSYISQDYFLLTINPKEVGSSAMPHKINPIDFENAEGNFLLANALFEFLARKLPISRLQRDLTDSTVIRNVGVAFGHSYIAMESLISGLNKLNVNHEKLDKDLTDNWLVITEDIQQILKREGISDAYEQIKDLTRRRDITLNDLHKFITNLQNIPFYVIDQLLALTPQSYIGIIL